MEKSLILLVDDNTRNLQILGNLLGETYRTAIAQSGWETLEFVKRRLPDLILLDVMMPAMDGFEVCRRLKAVPRTADIPVIFLTVKTETEDVVKGFGLGGVDYVTKPFRKEELLARVRTQIALRHSQHQLEERNVLLEQEITERKQVEEQLKQTQKELEELNTNKDKFFSIIAHDLRGPLLFANHAEQKQIRLQCSLPEKAIAYADVSMVNTVIRNLLSNALKFTDSGGITTAAVRQNDACVTISVSDTGRGIEAQHLQKLFHIDSKYQQQGTAYEPGTGLGLILCQEFVEQNGGEIWVESDIGKGTTFTFTLPLPQESSPTFQQSNSYLEDSSEPVTALPLPLPHSEVSPSTTALVPPSQEILHTLLKAVKSGDILSIRQQAKQLISDADPQFAPFANRLSQLADKVMIVEIQEFLTQFIEDE